MALMKSELSLVERQKSFSYPNREHALGALSCALFAFWHISSVSHECVF